jgi:hypothetical protein
MRFLLFRNRNYHLALEMDLALRIEKISAFQDPDLIFLLPRNGESWVIRLKTGGLLPISQDVQMAEISGEIMAVHPFLSGFGRPLIYSGFIVIESIIYAVLTREHVFPKELT